MKIKALFVSTEGQIRSESVPWHKSAIEFQDGCHPFVPEGVYYDIDKKGPPIIVYWHGIPAPEGVTMDQAQEFAVIKQAIVMVQHKQKAPISRHWSRRFLFWSIMFFKALFLGFLTALTVIVLVILL